jgi:hypothetical protein
MLTRQQRMSFFALQSHYPTTAIAWVGGITLTMLYLLGGVTVTHLPLLEWTVLFGANLVLGMLFFLGMRRFNLAEHERRSWGFTGLALDLLTAPVYVAAAVAQLAGRPLQYVVTPKGSAATGDSWRTFRSHLFWLAVASASVLAGLALHHDYPTLYVWAGLTIVVCGAAPLHVMAQRIAEALPVRLARMRSVLRNRRVGDALVARGLLTNRQLRELLDLQATRDAGWVRLGDLAVAEGYLSEAELSAVLTRESPSPQLTVAA